MLASTDVYWRYLSTNNQSLAFHTSASDVSVDMPLYSCGLSLQLHAEEDAQSRVEQACALAISSASHLQWCAKSACERSDLVVDMILVRVLRICPYRHTTHGVFQGKSLANYS